MNTGNAHINPELVLKDCYGIENAELRRFSTGAGSDTFLVIAGENKYILKHPSASEINVPEAEPELCNYLLSAGIPVCRFIANNDGSFVTRCNGELFHLQHFIEGTSYGLNEVPQHLMPRMAVMLARIHNALRGYHQLHTGIGADFFRYMTPQNALNSYRNTLAAAIEREDEQIVTDLEYRIGLLEEFPKYSFALSKLTCLNTHGDYFTSQLIFGDEDINAVIDWTSACVHPAVWELVRSFVYGARSCKDGCIDITEITAYFRAYAELSPLSIYDLANAAKLFYYQISVCDYYGQYYGSDAENREIYLHQAVFSTKLMKWFSANLDKLSASLSTLGNLR